jgi:hypothetical protein
MTVGCQGHALAALPLGKDLVHIVQEAGWAPGPVWTGAENLSSTGIRSPDRTARSEWLYRLRYSGPNTKVSVHFMSCRFRSYAVPQPHMTRACANTTLLPSPTKCEFQVMTFSDGRYRDGFSI